MAEGEGCKEEEEGGREAAEFPFRANKGDGGVLVAALLAAAPCFLDATAAPGDEKCVAVAVIVVVAVLKTGVKK